MTAPLAELASLYRFNNSMLNTVIEGFTPEDWTHRADGGNSAAWILGHLAYERRVLLRGLGLEIEEEAWERMFTRGTRPVDAPGHPTPDALADDFRRNGEIVCERLTGLTAEEAEAEWGTEFPQGSRSTSGGAHFLLLHECYHLGQIGLLRRLRGKAGIA